MAHLMGDALHLVPLTSSALEVLHNVHGYRTANDRASYGVYLAECPYFALPSYR